MLAEGDERWGSQKPREPKSNHEAVVEAGPDEVAPLAMVGVL